MPTLRYLIPLLVLCMAGRGVLAQGRVSIYNTRQVVMSEIWADGHWVGTGVEEDARDLNGDGDRDDLILHLVDLRNFKVNVTGLPLDFVLADDDEDWPVAMAGDTALVQVSEVDAGKRDLNGNGVVTDNILVLYETGTRKSTPLGVHGSQPRIAGDLAFFVQRESVAAKDLNGDKDLSDRVLTRLDLKTKQAESLGMDASGGYLLHGDWIAAATSEAAQGMDLNKDGDLADSVVQLYQISTGKWTNTSLPYKTDWALTSSLLAVAVDERAQGNKDLNGNGKIRDLLCHVWDLSTGKVFNTGLDASGGISADGKMVAFGVDERVTGKDFNADRDMLDTIAHVYQLGEPAARSLAIDAMGGLYAGAGKVAIGCSEADQKKTDLNGDKDVDDYVLLLYNPATGKIDNLKAALDDDLIGFGGRVAVKVSEEEQGDSDLNGDRDVDDVVLYILDMARGALTTTGAAISDYVAISERGCGFAVYEEDQGGLDLNMNGAVDDDILFVTRFPA